MIFWLKKLLRNPRGIGSVAPSSPQLAQLMAKFVPANGRTLELGPGSGAITEEILKRTNIARLELIEADAELAAVCSKRFPGVHVRCEDAETLLASTDQYYDAVVSGIPFVAMSEERRRRIFGLIHQRLAPNGVFIMFQYSLTTKEELQKEFGKVDVSFMPWNVPPAFVYTVSKQ